jgi:hypothetical protein
MRSRLMMTLVVVLACCSWLVGTAGPLGAGPTDPTVVFGAATVPRGGETKVQAITNLETQLGRKLALVRVYYLWDQPFPDSYINWLQSTGHNLFLSVRAKRTNGTYVP